MTKEKIQHNFFFVLLGIMTAVGLFLMSPYADVFFVALMFAIVFRPMYKGILRLFRGKKTVSALLTTLVVTIVVLAPLGLFGYQIVKEAQGLYGMITNNEGPSGISSLEDALQRHLPGMISDAPVDIGRYVEQGAQWVVTHLGFVFSSIAAISINVVLVLFSLFFLLKDEDAFRAVVMAASPLGDAHNEELIDKIERAIASVAKGTLVVALIQGILTGIGFIAVGIANPVLWGSVAMVAAVIPAVGTGLVMIPAILYLVFAGHMIAAVVLAVWGFGVVGVVDNIVRPALIEREVKIHPLLIMFSALGGMQLFGIIGFFIGPVMLSVLSALFEMYPRIVEHPAQGLG